MPDDALVEALRDVFFSSAMAELSEAGREVTEADSFFGRPRLRTTSVVMVASAPVSCRSFSLGLSRNVLVECADQMDRED